MFRGSILVQSFQIEKILPRKNKKPRNHCLFELVSVRGTHTVYYPFCLLPLLFGMNESLSKYSTFMIVL